MVQEEILTAKKEAGPGAYLWLHDSGDCMLWPDAGASVDDDGKSAIGRWQLSQEEAAELIETGEVEETA